MEDNTHYIKLHTESPLYAKGATPVGSMSFPTSTNGTATYGGIFDANAPQRNVFLLLWRFVTRKRDVWVFKL